MGNKVSRLGLVRFCRLIKLSRTTHFGSHPVVPPLSAVNFYPKAGVFSWLEDGHKHMLNVHVPLEEDLEVSVPKTYL